MRCFIGRRSAQVGVTLPNGREWGQVGTNCVINLKRIITLFMLILMFERCYFVCYTEIGIGFVFSFFAVE